MYGHYFKYILWLISRFKRNIENRKGTQWSKIWNKMRKKKKKKKQIMHLFHWSSRGKIHNKCARVCMRVYTIITIHLMTMMKSYWSLIHCYCFDCFAPNWNDTRSNQMEKNKTKQKSYIRRVYTRCNNRLVTIQLNANSFWGVPKIIWWISIVRWCHHFFSFFFFFSFLQWHTYKIVIHVDFMHKLQIKTSIKDIAFDAQCAHLSIFSLIQLFFAISRSFTFTNRISQMISALKAISQCK